MNGLREKFRNKKGFTLIEMLIVVAIIAILVAVSIPLVGTALERAREATDNANLRAAKAEALIMYMNDQTDATSTIATGYWYDINDGMFYSATETGHTKPTGAGNGYNQSTTATGLPTGTAAKGAIITVTINAGTATPVTVAWTSTT